MDIQKILADPIVQSVIKEITANCSDTLGHKDGYSFITRKNICQVCYEGATKVVFLHNNWDFVIKVPKYYHYRKNNYCQLEVEHYQSAVQFRVEKVLLETKVLTTLPNDITLYVQPCFQIDHSSFSRDNRKRATLIKRLNNNDYTTPTREKALQGMYDSYRIDSLWFCRLVQLYGKKFARSLEKWSQINEVGDLHSSNVGWYNNKPIILDYAGYYGDCYYY